LIRPEALKTHDSNDAAMPLAIVERIISELKATDFEAEPPQLNIRFSGDLAEPDKLFVEAVLWGEKVRRQEYRFENIYLAITARDGVVALRQLVASDTLGALRASGSFHPTTYELSLHLESNLDAQAVAKTFHLAPDLAEFVFYTPPVLDLTAQGNFGESPAMHILGRLELGKFAYKSVVFRKARRRFFMGWRPLECSRSSARPSNG
jgi:hypothetical protein